MRKCETAKCIDCGAEITRKSKKKVRCPDCKKEYEKKWHREYAKRRYIASPKKVQKKQSKQNPQSISLCKKTKSCIYGGKMSGIAICDYIGITGHSRGCPVEDCKKYKRRSKREQKVHREDDNLQQSKMERG